MNSLFICLVTFAFFGALLALPAIQPRVVGGHAAKPHEFPYLVSIAVTETNFSNCGGTILSDKWILTAGHCVYEKELDEFVILAGKHDLSKVEAGEQLIKVKRYIPHKDFSLSTIGPNDIGLIELVTPLKFSKTVKKIDKLPKKDSEPDGSCTVSGWGSTSLTLDPEFPNILQTVDVTLLPYDYCKTALEAIEYTKKHLCTGPITGQIGHCSGDSGGALVQRMNKKQPEEFTIVGVISFNYTPCGTENIPPAFTKVSAFIDWIQEQTKLKLNEDGTLTEAKKN